MVRPMIVQVRAVAGEGVQLAPLGLATTEYPVMVDPPFELGAAQRMRTWVFFGVVRSDRGTPGTPNGIDVVVAAVDAPAALLAVTENV